MEHLYRKWLALPDVVDLGLRQKIHELLRSLYYGWAIARLYQLRFTGALHKIEEIRAIGDSYGVILFILMSRAARKLSRTVVKPYLNAYGRRIPCN